MHFILIFKVMYWNAWWWSVRLKHVAYIEGTDKICCDLGRWPMRSECLVILKLILEVVC